MNFEYVGYAALAEQARIDAETMRDSFIEACVAKGYEIRSRTYRCTENVAEGAPLHVVEITTLSEGPGIYATCRSIAVDRQVFSLPGHGQQITYWVTATENADGEFRKLFETSFTPSEYGVTAEHVRAMERVYEDEAQYAQVG